MLVVKKRMVLIMNGKHYISIIIILLLSTLCSSDTTFFDNEEDSFVIGEIIQVSNGGNSKTNYCSSLWVCDEWTSCSIGIRSRTCVDINNCEIIEKAPLLISCLEKLPKNKIDGCVTLPDLNIIIRGWRNDLYRFDLLDEGIRKWKHNTGC